MHTTRYMIIENGLPIDNGFLTKAQLFDALPFADYDAEISAFDLDEFMRDGSTTMTKATEDLVTEWWSDCGHGEVWNRIVMGKPTGLAARFYADEIASMEARVA
jgi:hypothetical protein